MATLLYLHVRMLLSEKRAWIVLLVAALPLLLSVVIGRRGPTHRGAEEVTELSIYCFVVHVLAVSGLLSLLLGSSLVASEVENRTITYLFTRPVARWRIVAAKFTATCAFLLPPVALSLLGSWFILGAPGGAPVLGALMASAVLSVPAYTAVFALLGTIAVARALVVGIVYIVFFEGFLSLVPAVINSLTISYYLRSLAVGVSGIEVPTFIERIVGNESPASCVMVIAAITAIGVGLAALIVSRREFATPDAV